MLSIIELVPENKEWIEFLKTHEHLIIHTPKYYEFLKNTFNQKPLYLAAVDKENKIHLILPCVHIQHPIFGKKIISTGYIEYGGFAGKKEYVSFVLDYLKKIYSEKVSFVEIRQGIEQFDEILNANTTATTPYKRFLLPLKTTEEIWKNFQKHKRKAINKSEEDGVIVKELDSNYIGQIYKLYLKNMRSFGSPPYSKQFFENFIKHDMGKIFGAFIDNKLVSVLVGYCYQKRIHIIIAVSEEKYLIHRPNDAVHWAFIKYGCENNYQMFDFGRTREGSGQHEYKEKFGATMHPLNHYYLLFNNSQIPNLDPHDKKMALATKLWKFLPLKATEKLGHWLREGIGI